MNLAAAWAHFILGRSREEDLNISLRLPVYVGAWLRRLQRPRQAAAAAVASWAIVFAGIHCFDA